MSPHNMLMKRFFILGGLLLLFAFICTVFVWYLIQASLQKNGSPVSDATSSVSEQVPTSASPVTSTTTEESSQAISSEMNMEESILLSSLPLSDGQISFLKAAGIDVETFVITPAMITCAKEKLSGGRFDAIMAGDTPTFTETVSLMGCIR